jgi:hypothetical protein
MNHSVLSSLRENFIVICNFQHEASRHVCSLDGTKEKPLNWPNQLRGSYQLLR